MNFTFAPGGNAGYLDIWADGLLLPQVRACVRCGSIVLANYLGSHEALHIQIGTLEIAKDQVQSRLATMDYMNYQIRELVNRVKVLEDEKIDEEYVLRSIRADKVGELPG